MTKKLTSQKSPIWQKLNLSPVGCCGDWSGPPTYSLTIIIVLIIFALVTTSQLKPLHEKKKNTDHHDRWMLSWWCDRECQHIQLHYSLFLCTLNTLPPPFFMKKISPHKIAWKWQHLVIFMWYERWLNCLRCQKCSDRCGQFITTTLLWDQLFGKLTFSPILISSAKNLVKDKPNSLGVSKTRPGVARLSLNLRVPLKNLQYGRSGGYCSTSLFLWQFQQNHDQLFRCCIHQAF